MSKLYPSTPLRAGHLGRAQQRHDTPSTRLRTRLRDALVAVFSRQSSVGGRPSGPATDNSELTTDNSLLWALKDVFFEACPEPGRRVKQGEVVGIPSTWLRTGIGRNGAGKSTLPSTELRAAPLWGRAGLKILSRITEPTAGRAYVRVNAPCCIERTNRVQSVEGVESNDET